VKIDRVLGTMFGEIGLWLRDGMSKNYFIYRWNGFFGITIIMERPKSLHRKFCVRMKVTLNLNNHHNFIIYKFATLNLIKSL
jgi:hypothetical protein